MEAQGGQERFRPKFDERRLGQVISLGPVLTPNTSSSAIEYALQRGKRLVLR